jgi:RIO kinase 2
MKLDVTGLRYLSKDDFRVLTALEAGMRNHAVVPTELIAAIASLRGGGIHTLLGELLRAKLIGHEHLNYDGFKLTYPGYDCLALKTLLQRGVISGVGRQIGVGKESDIFLVQGPAGQVYALKLQRLGRTSFRTVKAKRDYLKHRKSASWLYLSRLATLKEFSFMTALADAGFPVPTPIAVNRHALVMTIVRGRNLSLLKDLAGHAGAVFAHAMTLMLRLASCGLVHCDFNEFNLLAAVPGTELGTVAGLVEAEAKAREAEDGEGEAPPGEEQEPPAGLTKVHPLSIVPDSGSPPICLTLIDFPQMVSLDHPNARELFERDVNALAAFFTRRFDHRPEAVPTWEDALEAAAAAQSTHTRLDKAIEASGFSSAMAAELEALVAAQGGPSRVQALQEEEEGEEEEGGDGGDREEEREVSMDLDVTGGQPIAFVTVAAAVLEGGEEEVAELEEGEEEEGEEDAGEEEEESAAYSRALSSDDPALARERLPDGLRTRPGGRRPRPAGGEAYLRRAEGGGSEAGGGDAVAGFTRASIRERVKGVAEKDKARADAATAAHKAGRANKGGGMKQREKGRAREIARDASGGDSFWG